MNLALIITSEENVILSDGRQMNKQALYLEAIKWNPEDAMAYYGLALTLA